MSTSGTATSSTSRIWRTGLVAAVAAIVINLVVLTIARLAGADLIVEVPGQEPREVGVVEVVAVTGLAVLVGTGILYAVRRRGAAAWRGLAALGLVFALISVAGPLTADGTAGSRWTLASLHVLTGLVWFTALWRAAPARR